MKSQLLCASTRLLRTQYSSLSSSLDDALSQKSAYHMCFIASSSLCFSPFVSTIAVIDSK